MNVRSAAPGFRTTRLLYAAGMSQPTPLQNGAPSTGVAKRPAAHGVRWFWFAVAVATIVGVFVLPMAFPLKAFVRSSSYVVGFNNLASAIAVVGISASVTAWMVWKRLGARVSVYTTDQSMPLRWLGFAVAYAIVFSSVLGTYLVRADLDYGDIGYLQSQIWRWSHDHATLYRDFEFAYGPILFYWPAYVEKLLHHVGIGPIAAYMLAEGAMQILGLGILFYLLQQLPLSRRLKGIALAAITFGTLIPLLGFNYTMLRFAIAYAALLWIAKFRTVGAQAVWLALAEAFMLGISPEVGIAFAGGAIVYALYRGIITERRWLWLIPVPEIAFGAFALVVDKNYFFTMSNFSKGLLTQVVEPLPYIDAFLVCAVVFCPLAMAGYIRRYGREAGPMVGVYVASLAMVPSALGRCDELHVFFSWVGLFVLSLIGIDAYRNSWAKVALGLMVVVPVASQIFLFRACAASLGKMVLRGPSTGGFDLSKFEQVTAGGRVYIPIMAPQFVARALDANGQIEPSYFSYTMNAETVPGLQRKMEEMHRAEFVLMPTNSMKWVVMAPMNNWKYRIFRLGYAYKTKRPAFDAAGILAQAVRADYVPVGVFGTAEHEQYMLYRRNDVVANKTP
jgi:hypothetical protein